jgi:hypothetical protein
MGKGHEHPVPIYKMAKPRSGMGGTPGEIGTGLVTTAPRRKWSIELPRYANGRIGTGFAGPFSGGLRGSRSSPLVKLSVDSKTLEEESSEYK